MDSINKQILSLRNKGKSLREIGRELGISHVAVKKRLGKLTANRPDDKPDQGSDTVIIDFDNRDLDYLWPDVGGAISRLDRVLKELKLKGVDRKIIMNPGFGWKFEKIPW